MFNIFKTQTGYTVLLCSLLVFHSVVYLTTHKVNKHKEGCETIKLQPAEINFIVTKLDLPDTSKKLTEQNRNKLILTRIAEIGRLLKRNYPDWKRKDSANLCNILPSFLPKPSYQQIESIRIVIDSRFWLVGQDTYIEIIFWTIFGVLASLIYLVADVTRDPTKEFDPSQIFYQLAKLFYAPLISMILIFGYQYASDGKGGNIEVSKMILVVAFLLGFYSGRAMELLNRIKEVLLPFGSSANTSTTSTTTTAAGSKGELTVALDVLPTDLPQDSDYELIKNQLTNAKVSIMDNATQKSTDLTPTPEEMDASFTITGIEPKGYTLKASLATAEGLNLEAEQKVDLKSVKTLTLNLKPTADAG